MPIDAEKLYDSYTTHYKYVLRWRWLIVAGWALTMVALGNAFAWWYDKAPTSDYIVLFAACILSLVLWGAELRNRRAILDCRAALRAIEDQVIPEGIPKLLSRDISRSKGWGDRVRSHGFAITLIMLGTAILCAIGGAYLAFNQGKVSDAEMTSSTNWSARDLVMLGAGAVLSFVVGLLVWWIQKWRAAKAGRILYSPIAGSYTAYLFQKGANGRETDFVDYSQPSAVVTISYERKNILNLELRETGNKNIWRGRIVMETPTYGSLTWQYDKLDGYEPPREHRFGFKRCIYTEANGKDGQPHPYLYLIGEDERGYGREALEKNLPLSRAIA